VLERELQRLFWRSTYPRIQEQQFRLVHPGVRTLSMRESLKHCRTPECSGNAIAFEPAPDDDRQDPQAFTDRETLDLCDELGESPRIQRFAQLIQFGAVLEASRGVKEADHSREPHIVSALLP